MKMALTVEATRDEYGEDLAERLETTAKKIQTEFGIEETIMKEFHTAKEASKDGVLECRLNCPSEK